MQTKARFLFLKRIASRVLCNQFTGGLIRTYYRNRLTFDGVSVLVPSRGVSNASCAAIFWGMYESAERRFIKRYLHSDLPTVELGSSLGGVSSHIAKSLAHGQTLVCVEANPFLIDTLKSNLAQNASHLKTTVINAAIHYDGPRCHFDVQDDHLVSSVNKNGSSSTEIDSLQLRDIDLVNAGAYQLVCDIEGAESQILTYDSEALANCRRIIIELHDSDAMRTNIESLRDGFLSLPSFHLWALHLA